MGNRNESKRVDSKRRGRPKKNGQHLGRPFFFGRNFEFRGQPGSTIYISVVDRDRRNILGRDSKNEYCLFLEAQRFQKKKGGRILV